MSTLNQVTKDKQNESCTSNIKEFIHKNNMTAIEEVNNVFEWLYHIKELTVEKVVSNIIESVWTNSDDDIQELISCILQVIRTRCLLHPYLVDLLFLLDKYRDEKNHLNILMPYFIKRLMYAMPKSKLYCSFMYRLIKKDVVTMENVIDFIIVNEYLFSNLYKEIGSKSYQINNIEQYFNLISWFYPEICEKIHMPKDILFNIYLQFARKDCNYIYNCDIDDYNKMRDLGEPIDEVTNAILHDDVDKLQTIISSTKIDLNDYMIPQNIYDVFNYDDQNRTLINYAAECGSLKCFKYLLLNHATLNNYSFSYAVFGGNNEIIRIIDQKGYNKIELNSNNDFDSSIENYDIEINGKFNDPIVFSIITHQNNLFDWIFESSDKKNMNNILYYIFHSVLNGNMHSFMCFFDEGMIDSAIENKDRLTNEMPLKVASNEGYYQYMQILLNFFKKIDFNKHTKVIENQYSAVNTGIFSIFELNVKLGLIMNINLCLKIAIRRDLYDIFYYIVDNLYRPINASEIIDIWSEASKKKSSQIFEYIDNKYNLHELLFTFNLKADDFLLILSKSCESNNVEIVQKLTDFILSNFPRSNFTRVFTVAYLSKSEETCQYFIDKKVILSISILINNPDFISFAKGKLALNLINSIENLDSKNIYMQDALNISIQNKEVNTIEHFLEFVKPDFDSLVNAVKSHDLSIFDLVLKSNNKPSLINKTGCFGSLLSVAVFEGDANMVKHLLSLPNINPNLYDKNNVTPVMVAISRFNLEILNIFIDYFGDDIQKQMWQFNDGLRKILHRISRETSKHIVKRKGRTGYPREGRNRFLLSEPEWHNFMSENHENISAVIHRLIEIENIDLNCHVKRYTLLTYACEANDAHLLNALLDSNKVDVNSLVPLNGNTPLMVAIDRRNVEIAEILIKNPQTDINHRNFKNQTALSIAVTNKLDTVVSLLINHPEFDPEESCLDYSFYISSGDIAKQLYEVKSLNINYINNHSVKQENKNNNNESLSNYKCCQYETTLIHAVNQKQIEMVDMIVKHPLFDPVKSQLKEAIFASVKNNSNEIYEYLLKLVDNDVNIYNQGNQSLLFFTIACDNRDFLRKVLNSEKFDPQKSDIVDAFIKSSYLKVKSGEFYCRWPRFYAKLQIMDDLLEYDENNSHLINFNELLPNGKSFFTSIYHQIENLQDLVQYYLNHGVDPNAPDRFGVYPLEHAIKHNSEKYVDTLLNSNRIDMSIRIKRYHNQSFLHLAVENNEIFDNIYDRNLIDINVKDDLGETPLMKACLTFNINILQKLFNDDNLDYKHRNNNGDDAFDIVRKYFLNNQKKNSSCFGKNELKTGTADEKLDYFNKIINYI